MLKAPLFLIMHNAPKDDIFNQNRAVFSVSSLSLVVVGAVVGSEKSFTECCHHFQ